ncbi:MAG: hydrogenase maturation nickel metallochaperone HypA [Acidobacteriota bacterium]
MHELSIALSMIEQIAEEAGKHGGSKVDAVYVRIGVLSGVDTEALKFAFQIAAAGTPFADTRLEIEVVPLLVYCSQCASTHAPKGTEVLCPRCITPAQQILHGRELEVAALEIA